MPLIRLNSWNVNGLRSIAKRDFFRDIEELKPDILCLQETKAPTAEVQSLCSTLNGYKAYVNSSKSRKGYSGTAILSLEEPLGLAFDMQIEEHDQEGRVITAEFAEFMLVTVYAPNSGDGLKRLDYRQRWDHDFRNYIERLRDKKPVIIGGDLNVAHQEIDISRPKENYNTAPGYTQLEIDGFNNLLAAGFTDSFRQLHPAEVKYTYWNQLYHARARNRGWRIDYFLVDDRLKASIMEADIYNQYMGSDHCPIGLKLAIEAPDKL